MSDSPTGRPTDYTEELGREICERIATNAKGLDKICEADKAFPSARTVAYWLSKYPAFLQSYMRARERQADLLFDQCLDIADDSADDIKIDKDGNERVDTDAILRAKLRVETRLRMAGKLFPKKYGDQAQMAPTVNVAVGVNVMSPDRLADLAARKRASIERRRSAQNRTIESGPTLTDSEQSTTDSGGPLS